MRNIESRLERLESMLGGGNVVWRLVMRLSGMTEPLCVIEYRAAGMTRPNIPNQISQPPYSLA